MSGTSRTHPRAIYSHVNVSLPDELIRWVNLWYCFLWANTNYYNYCVAKREEDESTLVALSGEFDQISRIYGDWGDIYFLDYPGIGSFTEWLRARQDIFVAPELGSVSLTEPEEGSANSTVLYVPHALDKGQALKQIDQILSDQLKLGLHRPAKPRYSIYPSGKLISAQVTSLEKTFVIYCLHKSKHPETGKGPSNPSIAIELSKSSGLFSDWTLNELEQKLLSQGDLKSSYFKSRSTQVSDYLTRAEKIIANTIEGVFPLPK